MTNEVFELMKRNILEGSTSSRISKRVCFNDYIMDSKFMVPIAQIQRYFKFVFDFSYNHVVECCEV